MVNRAMGSGLPGQDPETVDSLTAARPERVFARSSIQPDLSDPDTTSAWTLNPEEADAAVLRAERSAMQTSSWYLLLDLYLFLSKQLNTFWTEARKPMPKFALPEAEALFAALRGAAFHPGLGVASNHSASLVPPGSAYGPDDVIDGLIDALRAIVDFEPALETAPDRLSPATGSLPPFEIPPPGSGDANRSSKPNGWPDFLFLFADAWFGVRRPPTPSGFSPPAGDYLSEKIAARIDSLGDLLVAYLAAARASEPGAGRVPEPMIASMLPVDMREAWYVMRLVYERPDCAPFHGAVVSAATRPFQMAGFFDPDAPARPIRIGLPIDSQPGGPAPVRQERRLHDVRHAVRPGRPLQGPGPGRHRAQRAALAVPQDRSAVPDKGSCATGMMCSLSIPIITICALILLTIIVSLLEMIFHWLPFFTVCFPLPGFKGKKPLETP